MRDRTGASAIKEGRLPRRAPFQLGLAELLWLVVLAAVALAIPQALSDPPRRLLAAAVLFVYFLIAHFASREAGVRTNPKR